MRGEVNPIYILGNSFELSSVANPAHYLRRYHDSEEITYQIQTRLPHLQAATRQGRIMTLDAGRFSSTAQHYKKNTLRRLEADRFSSAMKYSRYVTDARSWVSNVLGQQEMMATRAQVSLLSPAAASPCRLRICPLQKCGCCTTG